MLKISGIKLTQLTVSGFKCFSAEQRFDLDDITYITGSNHVGKSSIADAITFAFTGKLYNGDSSMDRLYSDGARHLQITAELVDEHGCPHTLTRIRREDKMTIVFDGCDIRQKDMESLFGESDVFLSIFSPTFFIERLGNDGQKLLQLYLPVVEHSAVLERLTEHQRTLLEDRSMLSPETFIAQLREEIREDQESLTALTGQKDLLSVQNRTGQQELSHLQQQVISLDTELAALRKKRENGIDFAALEEKRTGLLLRCDELLGDKPEKKTAQLDLGIRRALSAVEETTQKQYQSKYTTEIAKLQGELGADGGEYHKLYAVFQNVRPGVRCPTCRRPITSDNQEEVKSGLNERLLEMMRLGMEKNTQLTQLQELDQKARRVFEQWKDDDLTKSREQLTRLETRRTEILSGVPNSLVELKKQLAEVEADLSFGSLTPEEHTQLTALEAQRTELEARHLALKALTERPQPDIAAQQKALEDSILQNNNLIAAALDYLGARNDLLFQNLPLNKVAFSLLDVAKTTGEVKNVFRFTYGGRDYRKLSHSEKIFAGMELSEMMKTLTGRNYPVFVDDAESIVSLAGMPSGQILLSRVIPKQSLTVTGRAKEPVQLQKAS